MISSLGRDVKQWVTCDYDELQVKNYYQRLERFWVRLNSNWQLRQWSLQLKPRGPREPRLRASATKQQPHRIRGAGSVLDISREIATAVDTSWRAVSTPIKNNFLERNVCLLASSKDNSCYNLPLQNLTCSGLSLFDTTAPKVSV